LAYRRRRPATLNVHASIKRFFRLGIGAIVTTMVFNIETWCVSPIGLPVLVTGSYAYLSLLVIIQLIKNAGVDPDIFYV
jgi:hypothetical protein